MRSKTLIGASALIATAGALARTLPGSDAAARSVPTVSCEAPRTLRLERFEDGSAKLLCNGRLLVRISVPH